MDKFSLRIVLVLLSGLFSISASAMFCPHNFNQVNIGDTLDQVQKQCGKSDFQKTFKPEPKVPQEWIYYQSPSTNPYTIAQSPSVSSATQTMQGTLKTSFAFNADGKLINITVGNAVLPATNICNGTTVQMGATLKEVEAACGKASYVNKGEPQDTSSSPAMGGTAPPTSSNTLPEKSTSEKQTEITEWTYNGSPKTVLVFENGKLKERK